MLCQQIEVSLGSVRNRTSAVFVPFVQYARQLGARIFAGNPEGICTTTAAKLSPRSFVCGLLIRYRNDSIALLSQSNLLILRNSWPTLEIGRTLHRYGPKQVIFSQGKPAVAAYYIQEGRIRLSVVSKQGKEATIALLGPDDFLGEGCIASNQPIRMATATAITRCSVLKIKRKETLRVLQRRSSLLVRGDQARTILWMCALLNRQ